MDYRTKIGAKSFITIILITLCLLFFINIPKHTGGTELSAYVLTTRNITLTEQYQSDEEVQDSSRVPITEPSPDRITPAVEDSSESVPITEPNHNKITQVPEDNLYLEQPSQEWIYGQFDKVYKILGYNKTEQREWTKCRHTRQQYYFENIETVFTGVPKSGCSNWIEALLRAEGTLQKPLAATDVYKVHGGLSSKNRMNWWKKHDLNESAVREAFSFTVIRNPWTRMVSGYRDKLSDEITQGKAIRGMGIQIVSEIRGIDDDTLYPTFEEYLLYLIKRDTTRNIHFIPQHELLCIPQASYDYIIPLEYSSVMYKDVWDHINTTVPLLGSYDSASDPRQQTSALRAKEWFLNINQNITVKLYDLYRADFAMMNYSNFSDPNFPLPLHKTEL